jgi:predicted MFS family arabinose efflux permease
MYSSEMNMNPYRWLLVTLAVLYYTMGFTVRFAWPPLIQDAVADMGISMSAAGSYMSAFYIGYVITQIPGGMFADRFGVRIVIAVALLLEGIGALAVGLAPNFALGFAGRVLTGLGAGAVYSSCIRYITTLFPPREQPIAFALMMMAPVGVGVILPNVLMPWLKGLFSWRGAFCAMSILVFAMGLVAYLVVRDKPQLETRRASIFDGLGVVLREKNLIFLGLACFGMIWVMVGFVSWGNTYIRGLGYSEQTAGLVMTSYGIAGIVASALAGVIAQRFLSPKTLFLLACLMMIPCSILFGRYETIFPLVALSSVIGLLTGLANALMPLLTVMFAPKNAIGTASGVTACICQCGAILGPLVMGWSKDITGTFSTAWVLLALGGIIGVLCILLLGHLPDGKRA